RRMNSLKLWLTLRIHGRLAYEEHIDRQVRLAREFARSVEASEEFELAAPVMLTIVNFRVKGARAEEIARVHAALVEEVTRDGQRWISDTVVNGASVLRMMVISYLTEERHLEALLRALRAGARKVLAGEAKTV
ncbi:MAG TPA: pyridoxal-dependent decarboxylase, partial [Terriglobales bacterium]|nr:pyridoxal-dependent decarboxylase [Terriglobales bacterium]